VPVRRLLLASKNGEQRYTSDGAAVVSSALSVITAPTALQVSDPRRLASPLLANLEPRRVVNLTNAVLLEGEALQVRDSRARATHTAR
jgi:hypothetical protein